MRVSIALATYNGEEHIEDQLDSLARQSYPPHELQVGDDGSTDRTLDIVEDFASRAPFPVHITRNDVNLGYSDNFLNTAARCSGEWVAFCDQDDVWLPNKIESCANAVATDAGLNLVLQNAEICGRNLERSGRLFPNSIRPGKYGAYEQYGFWVWPGFLQTVRREIIDAFDYVNRPINYYPEPAIQSRDKWTCMIANVLGGIEVIDGTTALYRRHDKAVTGDYAKQPISARIQKAKKTGADHYAFLSEVALSSSHYLLKLSREADNRAVSEKLAVGSEKFERLSELQTKRVSLYSSNNPLQRTRFYAALWVNGGYVGKKFSSMGFRSALKDFVTALVGKQQ